jgi:hypothetical protein
MLQYQIAEFEINVNLICYLFSILLTDTFVILRNPMSLAWSASEIEFIIADYFSMLVDELRGRAINKAQHRKQLKSLLNNRSDGSIEFKHQNISAVLIKHGIPFIKGYKPMWNFQQALEDKILEHLSVHMPTLEPSFAQFADSKDIARAPTVDFAAVFTSPPEKHIFTEPKLLYRRRALKINYLEREQNNSLLGIGGEEFVLKYERWRLLSHGAQGLAKKIEWVAKEDDGAGFDILSKNLDGSDRYIEVKTTKLSKDTPIFFSKNEYEFSYVNSADYHLYRVFDFHQNPKLFSLNGCFDDFCQKKPIHYKGFF